MTDVAALQTSLRATGRYRGQVDGQWGPLTEGAIITALEDGPDTPLTAKDYAGSAARLGCKVSHIKAVAQVEAAGSGFQNGFPKILPERHIFSKLTKGKFDKAYPLLSYPKWGTRPYPARQIERYRLLLDMARLDIDAGFAACSYGKFQILGQNHLACGYPSSWAFAFAMARDERTQLLAFERFLEAEDLLYYLRRGEWANFARRYNGTAYRVHQYDVKLARAAQRYARAA